MGRCVFAMGLSLVPCLYAEQRGMSSKHVNYKVINSLEMSQVLLRMHH